MLPLLALDVDPWYATTEAYDRVREVVERGFGSAWKVDAWGAREARLLMKSGRYSVFVMRDVAHEEGSFDSFDAAYRLATGFDAFLNSKRAVEVRTSVLLFGAEPILVTSVAPAGDPC